MMHGPIRIRRMAYLTEKTCLFIGEKVVTIPVKTEVLFVEM